MELAVIGLNLISVAAAVAVVALTINRYHGG